MKIASLLTLACSLALVIISAEMKAPFVLYIAVFGLAVSFLAMLDVLVIQPREKNKNSF